MTPLSLNSDAASAPAMPEQAESDCILQLFAVLGRLPVSGALRLLRFLYYRSWNLNTRSSVYGMTALHMAAFAGAPRTVALLLVFGANPLIPDDFHLLPLQLALDRQTRGGLWHRIRYGIVIRLLRRATRLAMLRTAHRT